MSDSFISSMSQLSPEQLQAILTNYSQPPQSQQTQQIPQGFFNPQAGLGQRISPLNSPPQMTNLKDPRVMKYLISLLMQPQ